MPSIKIDINGEVIERNDDRPANNDREPEPMRPEFPVKPDLQIVEITPTQKKEGELPPWEIQEIFEIINADRPEIKKILPS